MAFREGFVDGNEGIEDFSFARRQSVESRLQPFLQIFQDQRDEAYIGDFVFRESFADIFRSERAEMHHSGTADEGAEKTDHEINRVIGGEDAEIAKAGSEGVDGSERDALLEIVFVSHHAAFWAAAGAGGIDDGGHVAALARNEGRFPGAAKFLPANRAGKISI